MASVRGSLRELTREAVRHHIAQLALDLFSEHGFEQVTVEQIAAAAGISPRSFHRYFTAKEDAVLGDATRWADALRSALLQRPAAESPWEALHAAFATIVSLPESDEESGRRRMRLVTDTPSLRARNTEKHVLWARMLTPVIEDRLSGANRSVRAEAIVQAALVCFDVALSAWSRADDGLAAVDHLALAFSPLMSSD